MTSRATAEERVDSVREQLKILHQSAAYTAKLTVGQAVAESQITATLAVAEALLEIRVELELIGGKL